MIMPTAINEGAALYSFNNEFRALKVFGKKVVTVERCLGINPHSFHLVKTKRILLSRWLVLSYLIIVFYWADISIIPFIVSGWYSQ